MRRALERALPAGSVSPKWHDRSILCSSGFAPIDALPDRTRNEMVVTDREVEALAKYAAVVGHFHLATLLEVTSGSSIATVLREPRARLLSLFAYWRLVASLRDDWPGSPAGERARSSLDDFLAEPLLAQATDNVACRMLVRDDLRLPSTAFLAAHHVVELATAAIAETETLGFVGVLELGASAWRGLASMFGVSIASLEEQENVTGSIAAGDVSPLKAQITPRTLDLLEARTAADALLYRQAVEATGETPTSASRLADAAFSEQLVRLGDVTGKAAMRGARKIAELNDELWTRRLAAGIQAIAQHVPAGQPVVLVDDLQWGVDGAIEGRPVIPFLERDGEYWGAPPDSTTAARELERLRRDGVGFLAIAWPAFWWFDEYDAFFAEHLADTSSRLYETDDLVIFGLDAIS